MLRDISSCSAKMSSRAAIVAMGPAMIAGGAVDQLRRDAHAVAGLAHAAFEDVVDLQVPRHLLHVQRSCP